MPKRVAVFGGGVAGLSVAYELVCRGFLVDVYERGRSLGGKARSQWVNDPSDGGTLPGEHGFRFFPFFYRHVIDSMKRIPLDPSEWTPERCLAGPHGRSVKDNLIGVDAGAVGRVDGKPVHRFLRRVPRNPAEWVDAFRVYLRDLGLQGGDLAPSTARMLRFFTSCDERRDEVYEKITWWDFLGADNYSREYQGYLESVMTSMVAMSASEGNARTVGNMTFRLMMDQMRDGKETDRILKGPTSLKWIDPWRDCLAALGVRFFVDRPLLGLDLDDSATRIRGARVGGVGVPQTVEADYYVAAVPLDSMHRLVDEPLAAASAQLAKIRETDLDKTLRWMVGVQFYLKQDVPIVDGHVFYSDHPWALTTVSQAQFWSDHGAVDFKSRYGNNVVEGVISVDVSDWNKRGIYIDKRARDCTRAELREEIWRHLEAAVNSPGAILLSQQNVHHWHLDDDLLFDDDGTPGGGPPVGNLSPLMIHPPNVWASRPTARTEIENLMLASDYVRTATDLATMEGANEAARLAANAILVQEGRGDLAELWDHKDLEPTALKVLKKLDLIAYRLRPDGPTAFDTEVGAFLEKRKASDPPLSFDNLNTIVRRFMAL